MNNQNTVTSYKVLLLGNQEVGKTAIVNSWIHGVIPNKAYRPTAFNTISKSINFEGRSFQLELTDSAGVDDYSFIPNEYGDVTIANYDAFIIVYAINKSDSIKVADTIKTKIEKQRGVEFAKSKASDVPKVPLVLVGNKLDLETERKIPEYMGKELIRKWNLSDDAFLEVTAKDKRQINNLFELILKMLEEAKRNIEEPETGFFQNTKCAIQ